MRIAINGFGRIGRLFFRQVLREKDMEIVAVNDLGKLENLAYLLQYDSVYGKLEEKVLVEKGATGDWGKIAVDKKSFEVFSVSDPSQLPWGKLDIDVVVEATGVFESYDKAKVHIGAGAKRVVITAPAKDEDGAGGKTILAGVNENEIGSCAVTSNGSCTTNAVSSVIQILDEYLGVEKAILSTTHGYTATQSLVDGPVRGSDPRRGRAAAQNIVPSTTGAAIAVTRAIPKLAGKFDGIALRVPVAAGSIADITFVAKRDTTPQEVNEILVKAEGEARWKGIMKTTAEPVVSSDILKEPYGAIVDLNFTKVVGGNLVKVLSWYDNEWGYVSTLVQHVKAVARNL
ncbi:MAG: type I glyceraldehyde-3-phosphate dehydrogenase [Candidatus Wildermuthbacteria bacterium]|nr:type I glyceraldehyde-3-phosphate dehydrogenase [Candidatus Wildermuthbacteria bacterium]